jgi:undecaprenyl-diphosphatase
MSKMNRNKFVFWSVFSSFSWVISFLLLGYLFGQAWETIALWSTRGSIFLVGFFSVIAVLYILKWLVIIKGKQLFNFLRSIWQSVKIAIAENSDVKKFTEKHSVFFKFIKARFNKNKFWGLPTTLLTISFIYTLSLLGGIVEDIISSDIIVSVDTRVMNLLALFRNADLTQFFLWVTLLGKWQVVLGFVVAVVGILWMWRKRLYILPLLLTIVGAEIFTAISKIIFHRPRPELAIYAEHSFSFPSGHATIAIAFYGFITYILIRHFAKWKTKVNIFFVGIAIILLIGFSRLYLGVHYVSDVWGGYLVGALWLIIGISISEWIYSWRKKDATFISTTKTQTISAILIFLSLTSYIFIAFNYHPPIKQQQQVNTQEISVQNVMDIFTHEQLKYTETLLGEKQEPLSFIILANNDDEFVRMFEKSGWHIADNVSMRSFVKITETVILKREYLNAPMTPSFWNKKTHDFGFEKPTKTNNVRQRHHARFWKTDYKTLGGERIYVGTASLDSGIKWGVTHKIDPSIDTERETLFSDLHNSKMLELLQKEQFVKPTIGENFSGDQFFTDGEIYILLFK